jgi:hypothetical protein
MEDWMGNVHTDEAREARRLLATAFETVPADPAMTGDSLLRAVRRRYARRLRTRALVSAGGVAAAAVTAAAVLLSVTVAAAPSALASVTGALSRAAAGSFRMKLIVTQHNTVPAPLGIQSPLRVTGKLDLKRNLGEEKLSNGWRTRIVGDVAYTRLPPRQAEVYGGKPWTEERLYATEPPYKSGGAQVAWDFNSDRPFNPQALLALLKSGAKVANEGSVSGRGWTGTRYRFTVSHPKGSNGLVDSIACTVDVDSQGHIRSLAQTTVFVASGKPHTTGEMIYRAHFTFSDFGIRLSVTPPPASQINHEIGAAIQF